MNNKIILRYYGAEDIETLPQLQKLSEQTRKAMKAVARVFPFRVNNYVIETLIDWNNIPDDPIFRLTFPQPEMLAQENLDKMMWSLDAGLSKAHIEKVANTIRSQLNPNPAEQVEYNVPLFKGKRVLGIQHKYPQTVLIFPTAGQTCHTYCTFCFRWSQFVGGDTFKFATRESQEFQEYIQQHQDITDVLITGGDPLTMKARHLALYIKPLLSPEFDHIQTIRIGTKSIAYYPHRFVNDDDADDLLQLFEEVIAAGKHLAIMAHYDHYRELTPSIAQKAIQRIRATGAEIRTQAPIIRQINDDAEVWWRMWQLQVKLGCVPYYMFIERDTGANYYFEIPLVRALEIYQTALKQVSGLAKTVRGPVMSVSPGKVVIDGVANVLDQKVFVLSFLQSRNPDWCRRPFFAKYDENATWLNKLKPAFDQKIFFWMDGA